MNVCKCKLDYFWACAVQFWGMGSQNQAVFQKLDSHPSSRRSPQRQYSIIIGTLRLPNSAATATSGSWYYFVFFVPGLRTKYVRSGQLLRTLARLRPLQYTQLHGERGSKGCPESRSCLGACAPSSLSDDFNDPSTLTPFLMLEIFSEGGNPLWFPASRIARRSWLDIAGGEASVVPRGTGENCQQSKSALLALIFYTRLS